MPKCELFYFNVFVNGHPLKEYTIGSEFYIESDLHTESSYCIEEQDAEGNTQRYPVTPFSIHGCINNTYDFPMYLKLCVDGQQIWMKPFPPHKKEVFRVKGYKHQHVIRELLFTLPRMDESHSPQKKRQKSGDKSTTESEADNLQGTISMQCIEAKAVGTFTTCGTTFLEARSAELSSCPSLCQSSKKHVYFLYVSGNVGVSTREGRSLYHVSQDHNRRKTMVRYKVGQHHFEGVVIKYRPRYTLQELGITDEAWNSINTSRQKSQNIDTNDSKSNVKQQGADEEVGNENVDPNVNEPLDFTDKFRKMNCYTPTPSSGSADQESQGINGGRLFCLSPRAKHKMSVDSPSAMKMHMNSPADFQKLNIFSPSDSNKVGKTDVNSPSELLHKSQRRCVQVEKQLKDDDNKQFRLIEIDDDVQILEEVDDDVIWMGDDSCCFLDISEPDISMVDLSEDI
ncbi:uncharacterized protein LOC132554395 [Ylistrum balloti]|uniref:uncharacterized protein LOC132554395 n=1 Tax=Ylistrum balloti TaxID=509963 RepID=UPI0029058171|nr:uncharacterized protein LOC132554395 [Ylistrum balloti]